MGCVVSSTWAILISFLLWVGVRLVDFKHIKVRVLNGDKMIGYTCYCSVLWWYVKIETTINML